MIILDDEKGALFALKALFAHVYRAIKNCIHYFPLLQNLVSRNLKKKYRRSVLGYVWCVLNPLLVMLIMNFVFSGMFKSSIDNYPVYESSFFQIPPHRDEQINCSLLIVHCVVF